MRIGLFLAAQYPAGDDPRPRLGGLPAIRQACVAPSDEEALAVARPFLDRKYRAYLVFRVQRPGLRQEYALRTLELLAKEVMPRVQPA